MIFHIATNSDGRKIAYTVKTEAAAVDPNFETVDISTDKAAIQALIQDSFDQIHSLKQAVLGSQERVKEVRQEAQQAPSYTVMSVATDETFSALPLAQQLHLAAMAVENARQQIR